MTHACTLGVSWLVQCWRRGRLVWTEAIPENLVVTEGRNTLLDRTFKTVPANVNWYVGLKGAGTPAAGDTMASHPTWAEITPYSNITRPALVPGTISNGQFDNAASTANFTINANTTVYGVFLTSDNTKGGTAGLLYSAGDFAAARTVAVNDVLSVTATVKVTAA